jgi:hypothetical protein
MKNYFAFLIILIAASCGNNNNNGQQLGASTDTVPSQQQPAEPEQPKLDTAHYEKLQNYLANGDTSGRWPVMKPYPVPGAVIPFNRVIAYYGNLFSNRMGALGKWPKQEMMKRLAEEVKKWNDADSMMPAVPALHYIAVTAQSAPGKDGKYRLRMPHSQIDTILSWAKEINAQVFIDVQVGLSDVQTEIPLFEKYLSMPNVHLGIDPEFAMKAKDNKRPGTVIGSLDAADINFMGEYLVSLAKKHNLPPKMLMVHRFTQGMVTNYKNIKLFPELQIIMDMDGWGNTAKKKSTYYSWIAAQPVQFTGFKLFYVNDTEYSQQAELMTREEILALRPRPVYIQYQ